MTDQSSQDAQELEFTGEYLVPGRAPPQVEVEHWERYRFARRFVSGKRVLDIACGTGYGTLVLAEAGARRVDGVDLLAEVVAHARSHRRAPNLSFQQGDICTYRSPEPYEVVVCFETIEHVPDHVAALKNLHALLVAGGTLLISTPNRPLTSPAARTIADRPANPYHVREFTRDELLAALHGAGFEASPEDVYGQRPQLYLRSTYLRKAYRTLCKPELRANPAVTALGRLPPQYFVIVANRA